MMRKNIKGFTIVELMVVILIVGILAAINLPLMKSRIDRSKWSEACTTAGSIRTAVRNYGAEAGAAKAIALAGQDLSDAALQDLLGFDVEDLEGTYFSAGDYEITSVNGDGIATITATGGSKINAPTGAYVLTTDGKWQMQ